MKDRYCEVNGLRLHAVDYGGEGCPPILFLHGGSAHAHWWDFVAPAWTESHHALALDQRGHGDSGWPAGWAYGSNHYVSDLEGLIATWGLGAPVLVGHSMGAQNVLLYAAEHSESLPAVVIIDTLPEYAQFIVDFLRSLAEKPARRFNSLDEAVAGFRLMPRETRADEKTLRHIARHTYRQEEDGTWTAKLDRRTLIREPLDVWPGLARITCPALVVRMTESTIMPRDEALKMVAALPAGRFAEIADSCHHVMLDNPAALVAAMRGFLSDIGKGPEARK